MLQLESTHIYIYVAFSRYLLGKCYRRPQLQVYHGVGYKSRVFITLGIYMLPFLSIYQIYKRPYTGRLSQISLSSVFSFQQLELRSPQFYNQFF